jgi:hypothetical protein
MPIGITSGANWKSAESKALKSNMATAFSNNLNWGRLANAADITAKTTDVIATLTHVGDYDVFDAVAHNLPDANAYYVSCIGGGYSVTGARYRARRTGGYEYIGDIITAGTITWMPVELNCVKSVTANYTISDYDRKIIINTADAVTLTIPEGLSLYRDIEIQRVVASINAITVATSGSETIEGTTIFVTHGSTSSSFLNTQIVRITKTGAASWKFTNGIVSGSNSNGSYEKYSDRRLIQSGLLLIGTAPATNGVFSFTFPISFVNTYASGLIVNYVLTSNAGIYPTSYLSPEEPTETGFTVTYSTSGTVVRCIYTAVGEW